jgi:DNA-binding IclR family transcriptional regulator
VRDAHIAAFATPIFGADDKFMAALVLSGPASRLISVGTTREMIAPQLYAAVDLSRRLGASVRFCEAFFAA